MSRNIIKDSHSGSYFVAGKGHSWGSFASWGEANAFIKQVEVEDKAYRARTIESRKAIEKRIAEEDADRIARMRAQREADRLLYEGNATSNHAGNRS